MAKKRKPKKPSEVRTYDVEMIRDFLSHLLWELRTSHYEMIGSGSRLHPELQEQLQRYMNKRQTVGLLFALKTKGDLATESKEQIRKVRERLRTEQLRCLEGLMPLFEEALKCADHPKEFLLREIGTDDVAKELSEHEQAIRRLQGE
jgi:hypothetical protein